MQLTAPTATAAPFVPVTALPAATGSAPRLQPVGWDEQPADAAGLVSIRYRGTEHGARTQVTVTNDPGRSGELWYQLSGSRDDAVRAARELALVEGFSDAPEQGVFARSSVAVLDAGDGTWQLLRLAFPEGLGDEMDAIISMPIDPAVTASGSEISIPFGPGWNAGFDRADRGIAVRFNDPRVQAVVGVDSIALAPQA